MKKNYSIVCLVQAFMIIALAVFPVIANSQNPTEAEKQKRCQADKNRIAELERKIITIEHVRDLTRESDQRDLEECEKWRIGLQEHLNKLPSILKSCDYRGVKTLIGCIEAKEKKLRIQQLEGLDELDVISDGRRDFRKEIADVQKTIAQIKNDLIALGCDKETTNIAGTWTYATEWVYTITQNGSIFNWYLAKNKTKADGTITGKSVSATWFYEDGSVKGSATGTVKVDASGRAIQIDWSNGVVFTRN